MKNKRDITKAQYRSKPLNCELVTRQAQDNQEMYIEGYFAVYNSETELWPGAFEEIAPGAFDNTLDNDIRALINHDTSLVLGRNKANTLELKADNKGLWGRIKINPNDVDAVNLYERVKRGDVSECSFGFWVISENIDYRDDGTIKWTMTEVDVQEVSVVTFPAYEETGVEARKRDLSNLKIRKIEEQKIKLKERLKNVKATTH